MTDYVVLARDNAEDKALWRAVTGIDSRIKARTAEDAIRQAAEKFTGWTEFVAIPARSWKPLTVTKETVTKITVGAAAETKP